MVSGGKAMQKFDFEIRDELGIHARPAGILAKEGKRFRSKVTLTKDGETADVTRLMEVMALGVKQGQTVTVAADGEDEADAIGTMRKFFEEHL